jgi:hypothetical protein
MSRLEGGLHGLKANPSARADDQDFTTASCSRFGPAWLTVMCSAGSRTARSAHRLKHMKELAAGVPAMRPAAAVVAASVALGAAASVALAAACVNSSGHGRPPAACEPDSGRAPVMQWPANRQAVKFSELDETHRSVFECRASRERGHHFDACWF